MNVAETKNAVIGGDFDKAFALLYGNKDAKQRYCEALDGFTEIFGDGEVRLFSAPGRTEVGGNHTDHQKGCVLAGGVDMDVIAVAAKTDNGVITVKSKGFKQDCVNINDTEPQEEEKGFAQALVRGVMAEFKARGYNVGGFNAYTTSNVLKGSGLSSSAAFEVVICVMLNSLYNDGRMDAVEMAIISQIAENKYYGKPCGLMDQMASSVGGFIAIDFKDTANPVIEKVDFDLAKSGYKLCIVNTGGNHTDLTDDYAAITAECKSIAGALGVEHLRFADEEKFYSNIGELRQKFGDRAVMRAIHFFADNRRAVLEKEALVKGDFNEFLRLINESGNSSFKYLQNVFSCKAPSEQGLSLALALTEKYLNGKGACRVHGGGFAGTIQCFIPDSMVDGYAEMIEKVFGEGNCYILNIRSVGGYEVCKNS